MYKEKSRNRKPLLLLASLMLLLSTLACADMFTEIYADLVDSDCRSKGMKEQEGVCVELSPEEKDARRYDRKKQKGESERKSEPGLAGTYVGQPPIPSKLQEAQQNQDITNFTIEANQVTIFVDEDGTAYGEKVLKYSYTATGEDDQPVPVSSEWIINIDGTLQEPPYQLNAIFNYHFLSPERDDKSTMEIVYDIQISGDIMSGAPSQDDFEDDEDNLEIFVFEATKQ